MKNLVLLSLILTIALSGCSKKATRKATYKPPSQTSRYSIAQDRAPDISHFNVADIPQHDVKPVKRSRYGNKSPYKVRGKTYYVKDVPAGYTQTGKASWYGKKFHGHTTSNMEKFDMYELTGAHRTLPLPSYVEVTNLANNKKVVVRVNDRGPFNETRIIDLSWAAAKALDYENKGVTTVRMRVLQTPQTPQTQGHKNKTSTVTKRSSTFKPIAQPKANLKGTKYLQVGAYAKKRKALKVAKKLSSLVVLPVRVSTSMDSPVFYRVRIGPLTGDENIIEIIQVTSDQGFANTKIVVE